MKKNILFIAILSLCILSLLLGLLTPAKYKHDKEITEKAAAKNNINKILNASFNKVAVINLTGVISSSSERNIFIEENSSINALRSINEATKDKSVKGIVIKINSPGGTVAMSQMLYNAVLQAREQKPVIALMQDVAASGGYYVASAADRIVAMPGTMTGSIGVIMSTMDFHRLLSEKLMINENVIKSGRYKDIGSSTRAMSNDERKLLQNIVNDSYDQFKEAITTGRVQRKDCYKAEKTKLSLENLTRYADGRVFTGRQAKNYGFVDANGDMTYAEKMMRSMVAQKNPANLEVEFVNYARTPNIFDVLVKNENQMSFENFLPQSMKYSRKPLYLWE